MRFTNEIDCKPRRLGGHRKYKKPGYVVTMSVDVIEYKENVGQAAGLEPTSVAGDDNPAILALNPVEQEIWRLHRAKIEGKEIAHLLDLRRDQVCRMISGIREKIHFLYRFWNILKEDENALVRFINGVPEEKDPGEA